MRILECAFDEMYAKGYAGASLDQILADCGVTKGALYHHFGSKADLAIAVIEEIIYPRFLAVWTDPVVNSPDPVAALMATIQTNLGALDDTFIEQGCPLNNLSQELSSADERFRLPLSAVFDAARRRLATALANGQASGTVRADADADAVATFVLAGLEGLATTLKTSRDVRLTMAAGAVLLQFLEGLRTSAVQVPE